jgi:ankyrin repeat protein
MAAATKGYDRVVRAILEHGCDINVGNSVGATALHLAAMTEMGQCVALLLEGEV